MGNLDVDPHDLNRFCTICKKPVDPKNPEALIGVAVAFCSDRHFRRWVKRVLKEEEHAGRGPGGPGSMVYLEAR